MRNDMSQLKIIWNIRNIAENNMAYTLLLVFHFTTI
jgi:hypothetical protein